MAAFQPLSWQSTVSGHQVGGELTINALRGHLAEHGVVSPQGWARIGQLDAALEDAARGLPEGVVELGRLLLRRIDRRLDPKLWTNPRELEETARLMTIPGVGRITALAIQAFTPPKKSFRRGRGFSAWLGLVPRQHTTGGKPRLGGVSKMGQKDLRRLLFTGAMAVVRWKPACRPCSFLIGQRFDLT